MTISTRVHPGVWIAILICAGLCAYSLTLRMKVESRNRAVSLAVEADQLEALAAAQGINLELAFNKLKDQGLTSVAISEDTIGDLVSSGEIRMEFDALAQSQSPVVRLIGAVDSIARVERGLRNRFDLKADQFGVRAFEEGGENRVELTLLHLSPILIRSTATGLDPQYSRAAKLAELDVIARHANPVGATKRYVNETLNWSREEGARYFLPTGDQVLGRRDHLATFEEAIVRNQILYASPEFAKIGGDSNVLAQMPESSVRLHAAQANEIDKLTASAYIERYAKAASERNVRILLLRPLSFSSDSPLVAFTELIGQVRRQLEREGLEIRSAHPYEDSRAPKWLMAAIGLSIAPIVVFLVSTFTNGNSRWVWLSAILAAGIGASCYVELGRNYTALIVSLAFPIAAFVLAPRMPSSVLTRFLIISFVSIVGGLCVAGLLNGLPYFVRADQFSGVKIAVFLPIAVVGIYFFLLLTDAKNAYRSPILWSQAVLGLVILAGLAFMASRTGNDNPAGVNGIELQLRSILEQWLTVRPRTKDFLIGHPALIVGIGMLGYCLRNEAFKLKWGGWTALALLVGAIGQTSLVNTLCHLHTPVTIGLIRIGIGMAIGAVAGLLLWQGLKLTLLKRDLANLELAHA